MRIGRDWRCLVVCTGLGLVQVLAGCARQTDGRAPEASKSTPASAETTASKDPLELLGVKGSAHLQEAELVPLRDGTHLMATVLLPDGVSQAAKRPAILIQSPYPIDLEFQMGQHVLARLVREGYVIAVVNDRGTQWSEGQYHWLKNASADGADVVQWVTQQPWSNGSVGAWGCSSSGEVNFALAKARPRGLKAIVAMAAATGIGVIPGFADQGVFYTGGVPLLDWAWWYHGNGYINHPKLPPNLPQDERIALIRTFNPVALSGDSEDLSWATHLPSQELLNSIGSPQTQFNALIKMKPNDPEWRSYDFLNNGDRLTVPVLHIDSWYDTIEIYGTAKAFEYLSRNSPDQYLIVGPGPHCSMGFETRNSKVGERTVGDARFDYAGQVVKWFDHWLKQGGRGEFPMARVQYYPLESNRWVSSSTWPPPSTARKFYLASSGRANGSSGDGRLIDAVEDGAPDRFLSDPLHPVPTHGRGMLHSRSGARSNRNREAAGCAHLHERRSCETTRHRRLHPGDPPCFDFSPRHRYRAQAR